MPEPKPFPLVVNVLIWLVVSAAVGSLILGLAVLFLGLLQLLLL